MPDVDAITVMAYFGVQFRDDDQKSGAIARLGEIADLLLLEHGCAYSDFAHYVDQSGANNYLAIAYWADGRTYEAWQSSDAVATWWTAAAQDSRGFGYFREIYSPSSDRFETLFSSPDQMEGVGKALGTRSIDEIQEHSYWGSARDRLPCSQTDLLNHSGTLTRHNVPDTNVVRVFGHENLALIRSGQDWADTKDKERELYLGNIEPVLRKGMDFLRDEGQSVGCYMNRYVRRCGPDGSPMEKSFGLSCWRSLADMEAWAAHHPTHLLIFGNFMQTVQELEFQLDLRLYHEVSVLRAGQQFYEYVNCHAKTGLLGAVVR
jgi:aldoxime dehydratase